MDHTFGSLFTGIGAGDYGLEQAGWSCRWQMEPDPYRRAVLERHWPKIERFGDIKDAPAELPGKVELIYGELPDIDPAWWEDVFRLVGLWRAPLWLMEASPTAFEGPPIVQRFVANLGYRWASWRTVGYVSCMRGRAAEIEVACSLKRKRLFILAGLEPPARDLEEARARYGGQATHPQQHLEDRPVLDEVEALVGLPVGWSCICGGTACQCEGRRRAVEEATVVHLLEWLGRWLASTPA